MWCAVQEGDEKHHYCECGNAAAVDAATTDFYKEEPGGDCAEETDGEEAATHAKGFAGFKTGD